MDTIKIKICTQSPEVLCKKDVLKNFAKFTEKKLCRDLQLY